MIVKQLIEVFDTLDSADASGLKVKEYLESKGATNVEVVKREKDGKSTDFVKVVIPGSNGRLKGGNAPSLGIIGRLGGTRLEYAISCFTIIVLRLCIRRRRSLDCLGGSR